MVLDNGMHLRSLESVGLKYVANANIKNITPNLEDKFREYQAAAEQEDDAEQWQPRLTLGRKNIASI